MNTPTEVFSLKGKIAIITGASKGIGEAIAHIYAAAGAQVIVNSRKPDALVEAAARVGHGAVPFAGNAGDPEDLKRLVQFAADNFGGVDIVVNNAATNPYFGPIANVEMTALDKILDVNLKGPFLLAQLTYPFMVQRGGGSIINISSVEGLHPEQYMGIYSVSKASLIHLTRVLAKEWSKDGVRVNAICPGLIQTKFSAPLWQNQQLMDMLMMKIPMQRMGQSEEMAPLALLLASNAGSYMTGGVYTADGGYTI